MLEIIPDICDNPVIIMLKKTKNLSEYVNKFSSVNIIFCNVPGCFCSIHLQN